MRQRATIAAMLLVILLPADGLLAQTGASAEAAPLGRPAIGMGFWTEAGGIEVNSVTPGSPAERAGIKVGMLITHANGTSLAGLSIIEVEKFVGSLTGEITFTVRELGDVKLRKAPIAPVGS